MIVETCGDVNIREWFEAEQVKNKNRQAEVNFSGSYINKCKTIVRTIVHSTGLSSFCCPSSKCLV